MTESQSAANRRGIAAMVLSGAFFLTNDTLVKLASETLPSAELLFVRGALSVVCVLGLAAAFGALPKIGDIAKPAVLIRAATDVAATFAYLIALFHAPIANVTAINLASPLMLTAFAAFVMKEDVGWRRWCAVSVGFVGVLLIVRPASAGFDAYALLAAFAMVLHTTRDLLTRRIDKSTPSIVVSLGTALGVTLVAGAGTAVEGFRALDFREWAILIGASVGLTGGYFFLIVATRTGEVSAVQPFRYMALLWALIAGWSVWGQLPDTIGWTGYALLVASGLYVFHRESVRARAAALAPAPKV
jgi:drug/metabolite transporter (DMT)-like permease